jgi:hypothetical protein
MQFGEHWSTSPGSNFAKPAALPMLPMLALLCGDVKKEQILLQGKKFVFSRQG